MKTEADIDEKALAHGAALFRALANPLRYRILQLLAAAASLPVETIYTRLGIDRSTCSQQLRILKEARLVVAKRENGQVHYSLHYALFEKINKALEELNKAD